jgi:hypothetical protein
MFSAATVVLGGALCGFVALLALALPLLEHYPLAEVADLKKGLTPMAKAGIEGAKLVIGAAASILPAIGAALAGIRFTADFDGKAARSSIMKLELADLRRELLTAAGLPDFARTSAALRKTSAAMAQDVGAFLAIYGRKPLTLPG